MDERFLMKHTLASAAFSTCIALVVVLAIIHFAPLSDIIISHSQYVPVKDYEELDQYEQIVVERMIRNKAIISVDSLWSLQVSFYQTIVSVLIALNAVIVGSAFVVIRSSSKDEVVKQSITQFEEFSRSASFTKVVQRKAKSEISKINSTYGDMMDELEKHHNRLDSAEDNIKQIVGRLAEMDVSEDEANSDGKIVE
jgi:signal transduction histidine kinase